MLHITAQQGRANYATLLLEAMQAQGLQLDIPDEARGWTPLFFAAYHRHFDVVKLLLGANFRQNSDLLGWTAKEHATFRGHLHIAALFPSPQAQDSVKVGPAGPPLVTIFNPPIDCEEDKDEYMVVVNLGATQKSRSATTPTSLGHISSKYNTKLYQGHNIELEVIVAGLGQWDARQVSLPILDKKIMDPFIFRVTKSLPPELIFQIIRSNSDQPNNKTLLGSRTALLTSNIDHFGPNLQSLLRKHTVPIINKTSISKVGTITFTFLIIKPFPDPHPNVFSPPVRLSRESASSPPILIGHRGLGMNFSPADQSSNPQLQIGENTVSSFLTAARLGASFVEFDVQLTRDLHPVIYHDFSLSESGTDVPIHDVTLDQYLYASNIQSPHGNPLSTLGHPSKSTSGSSPNGVVRPRSRSLGSQFEHGAIQVHDRMKHTIDYNLKGYKPNTRGEGIIQDTFATLREILTQLPEEIGLDVEVKYPRLHEAQAAGLAPVAIELNTFVDTVLQTLFTYSPPPKPYQQSRQIFLSSFTPEVCILLAVKQKTYPVMFITNADKMPMADMEVRAASLQIAVKFAKKWNLAGVVFACDALVLCPRLVEYVRRRGLVCASYGVGNNVPGEVEKQAQAGVDIIIADKVGLIAKTLRGRYDHGAGGSWV